MNNNFIFHDSFDALDTMSKMVGMLDATDMQKKELTDQLLVKVTLLFLV